MAATTSTISSPSPDYENPVPHLLLDPPSIASAAVSRRVPPPCWSNDETVALIDSYREKWYSLRRGNLRAHHWQEVADEVAARLPGSPKTSIQCRHKMEKLRKRYRGEKQRAAAFGGASNSRFKSSWVHFKRMDYMERGIDATSAGEDDEEEDDSGDVTTNFIKPVSGIYRNNVNSSNQFAVNDNHNMFQSPPNGMNGYRIRLPTISAPGVAPEPKFYANHDKFGVPSSSISSSYGGSRNGLRKEHVVRGEMGTKVKVDDGKKTCPSDQMVEALRVLGDGFVRTERMKMDMARKIEEMRMEMEMKRTEMILDSQKQIVEAFSWAVFGNVSKKQKKMHTSDC